MSSEKIMNKLTHIKQFHMKCEKGTKLNFIKEVFEMCKKTQTFIFVNTKDRAKEVHRELMFDGVHVDSLHASQGQAAREKAVEKFREGKTWVLIATDLVARGLDFSGV